ncbi:MAG: A/G-specific adenine glycosylase [Planctomycetota bacterium]|nr:A/G-specific adenine glycosylase [Planctomycetota bacterium]
MTLPDVFDTTQFSRNLLKWFGRHKRDLPFRRTKDPYAIWVSEAMLQQTQVATVLGYFERFMKRFPDIRSLAESDIDEVLKLWAGLGYYRRARFLHKGAGIILNDHNGVFPATLDAVLALPGVGRYTAGAILSIAFDQPVPILDGNVGRVLCRVFELGGDPTKGQTNKQLWRLSSELIPPKKAGEFNQSLMELGALVCSPKSPSCPRCPVRSQCGAFTNGTTGRFPEMPVGQKSSLVDVVAAVVIRSGSILICKRPSDAVNGGMWEFPSYENEDKQPSAVFLKKRLLEHLSLHADTNETLMTLKHSIMHRRFSVDVFLCTARGQAACADYEDIRWVRPASLSRFAMPSAPNQIRKILLSQLHAAEKL